MKKLKDSEIRRSVSKTYGKIAKTSAACGCSCSCGTSANPTPEDVSVELGYSEDDVSDVPKGANMGLGCGNPQALASLKKGETVLDLGSGGGFDCFLAAKAVGANGRVIGVDMTQEMLEKARENVKKTGFKNIEFRKGEIEHLPVEDNSVDVIMSNCVINLSPEKNKVYKEAFRVLKEGGRLAISDVVATAQIPDEVKNDINLISGCVAGAAQLEDLKSMLKEAGFTKIFIRTLGKSREIISKWVPGRNVEDFVASANIEAVKP